MKKRIGFLSFWGFGRGLAYVTLCYAKMLKDDYEIFILKQGTNPINEEFQLEGINVQEYPDYVVPDEVFAEWVEQNKLDAVVFNEYKQWKDESTNHIQTAKDLGCKVYGYLVAERFEPEQARNYDRILSPCNTMQKLMRTHRVRHFTYVPYSIDLKEFPKKEKRLGKTFTFFHLGGWGGVYNRKNTDAVLDAFIKLNDPNTKLIITSQKPLDSKYNVSGNIEVIDKDLTRQELIDLYYKADAVVLPSKWETVGIPTLEAMAAGVPLIVTDIPPMNEFVRIGINGYLCSPTMFKYDGIMIWAAEVDAREIKNQMQNVMNKDMYEMLSRNSRYVAEQLYNVENNKKYFINFLKEDLK